jgi:hypothetical protein
MTNAKISAYQSIGLKSALKSKNTRRLSLFISLFVFFLMCPQTESCMHRAGVTTTFLSPPDKNFAKTDNLKRWKPSRMVYDSMLPPVKFFLSTQ